MGAAVYVVHRLIEEGEAADAGCPNCAAAGLALGV
jgi:hypothetical protein